MDPAEEGPGTATMGEASLSPSAQLSHTRAQQQLMTQQPRGLAPCYTLTRHRTRAICLKKKIFTRDNFHHHTQCYQNESCFALLLLA